MTTLILWVAKRLGVTALLSSIIVYGFMALTATGTVWYFKHKYDDGKREEGRVECREAAAKVAKANKAKADEINAGLIADHAQAEAVLRRKLAAIRAAQSDACAKAPAKQTILDALK